MTATATAIAIAQELLDLPATCVSAGEGGFVDALSDLAALSSSGEQPAVMAAVARVLLAGSPREVPLPTGGLWFYVHPHGQNCPDLSLVSSETNRVVAVIEVKLDAHGAGTAWSTFDAAAPFLDDPLGDRAARLRPSNPRPHEWTPDCGCFWHTTANKSGTVVPAVPQIDSYRLTRSWVDAVPEISLDDPTTAAWVVLDRSARPLDVLYEDAVTASEWHTASMAELARTIADLHAHAQHEETRQALRAVAFHMLN